MPGANAEKSGIPGKYSVRQVISIVLDEAKNRALTYAKEQAIRAARLLLSEDF